MEITDREIQELETRHIGFAFHTFSLRSEIKPGQIVWADDGTYWVPNAKAKDDRIVRRMPAAWDQDGHGSTLVLQSFRVRPATEEEISRYKSKRDKAAQLDR